MRWARDEQERRATLSATARRNLSFLPAALVGGLILIFGFVPEAATQQADDFMGSDLCQECHPDEWETFTAGVHYSLELEGAEFAGCETCHGAGLDHVDLAGAGEDGALDAIITFSRESAKEKTAQCLTCHAEMETQQHYGIGDHMNVGVACSDCHSAHEDLRIHASLQQSEPGLCFQCHGETRGQFVLPNSHPVYENKGFMVCSDCHNPHGTTNRTQLWQSGNDTCAECHAEKKGPWVFPHVPVETDGCTVCHQPHGSTNNFMLNYAETWLNCLQCHTAIPSFHQMPARQECTSCHAQIHGSNLDPNFLR